MTDRRRPMPPNDPPMAEWLDRIVEALLIALLAFGPLALGVVHAWSEQVVITLAALIALVFVLKLSLCRDITLVWSWTYIPVAVFALVAVLQLVPLPSSVVQIISPNTASLRRELLGDLPNAAEVLSSMTLSFYPHATQRDLRLVLAVAVVFFVVVNVYRDPVRIKRLLIAVTAIGGGIALLALAQVLAGNGRIYWVVPTYGRVANSGPFINHSHYGQFMNLSIGAALGLLFVLLHEAFTGRLVTPARVAEYLGSPAGKIVKILLAMMTLAAATVFISLTRGGMIGMLIAASFTTMMLGWRQSIKGRGWILVLLAVGAFICVLWIGFDQVYDRLATLREFNEAEGGRWQIVKNIALAWTKFPAFGVGLGTHEVVYPMFDRSTVAALAMHAENEYAQAAEETGLIGFLALALFGTCVWIGYSRSIRVASLPICSAAYGLGFGLLAILIHSLSDFGQHLPANAVLSAVCCGLLIALSHAGRAMHTACEPHRSGVRATPCFWRPVALLIVVCASVWAILGADSARVARAHWDKVLAAEKHLEAAEWWVPQEAYEYLFTHATAAAEAEPGNIHYQHWLGVYKWLSLTPYSDPNTGQLPPEVLPWLRQIVDQAHQARPLCPTFGPIYGFIGQIEHFLLGDPNGAERIRKGYRLAPGDAAACFAAARIDAEAGRAGEAFEKLARAVQLDGNYFQRAVHLCTSDLNRGDLALQLAGDNAGRLAYVGTLLASLGSASQPSAMADDPAAGSDDHRQLADQAQTRVFEQLRRRCAEPDAPASAHASLANLYRQRGDLEAAIGHYQRAVRLDYDQVSWHYALAQLLAQADRADDAIHQARICLRLRPDHTLATRLIEQLSDRPMVP